jgi:hypothetical protein
MSFQTCIFLQAQPDFSSFWFTLGLRGALLMELRFTGRRNEIFDLTIERRYVFEDPQPPFFNEQDVYNLLHAVVQAIELYTGKYPERSVRCRSGDQIQSTIFRIILRSNQDILAAVFSIDQEEKERFRPFSRRPESPTFLLKRKPDPQRKAHPIQHTLNTYSQLFGNPVHIRLCEQNQVGDN